MPRPRNRFFHPESLLYFCLIVLATFGLVRAIQFFPGVEQSILGYTSTITADEVLTQTNEQRETEGLRPLTLNPILSQAALQKAQDMFQGQYWSHTAPDGEEPWDFIHEAGYSYKTAGENLARDFSSTGEMFDAWMASPTHRENILNGQFQEIGIAVVSGTLSGFQTTLVVQMFGTPATGTARAPQLLDPAVTQGEVLSAGTAVTPESLRNSVLLTPLQLTKAFFLGVIILIVATLIYDSFIARHRGPAHLVNKNLGHLMVFGAVIFIVVFFRSGMVN